MRNKTTEVTEGHREGVFGIVEYIHEEVAFVEVNYAWLHSSTWYRHILSHHIKPPQQYPISHFVPLLCRLF